MTAFRNDHSAVDFGVDGDQKASEGKTSECPLVGDIRFSHLGWLFFRALQRNSVEEETFDASDALTKIRQGLSEIGEILSQVSVFGTNGAPDSNLSEEKSSSDCKDSNEFSAHGKSLCGLSVF